MGKEAYMNNKKSNKASSAPEKTKDTCEKYGIAITDYILNEEMSMSREELFNHLASCAKCQKDLSGWSDTYSAMRNKAYMEKPETKQKYNEMLERIKSSSCDLSAKLPDGVDININLEYGWHAGILWRHLGESGPTKVDDIPAKINLNLDKAKVVTGWLMGEKKVCVRHSKNSEYLYLTKEEQEKYRQVHGKPIRPANQAQA